jgi:putative ABC transport system permease protein
VDAVTFASTALGTTDGHYLINSKFHGHPMRYSIMYIDYDFMSTMGIKFNMGRDFNEKDRTGVIINKAVLRQWPWLDIDSYILTSADDDYIDSARIVGVCEDIRYGTMRVKNDQPFAFILDRDYPGDKLFMRVAAGSDLASIRQQANPLVQDFSDGKASYVVPYNNIVAAT